MPSQDKAFMRAALEEARLCIRHGAPEAAPDDVPVGAVCVSGTEIIARAHNRRALNRDPLAHAEVLAIQQAAQVLHQRILEDVTLYVTLEPCPMCAGAIWLSRIERVVFAAWDEKAGACGSVFDIARDPRLNHRPQVLGGVLREESEEMLREFFRTRRAKILRTE